MIKKLIPLILELNWSWLLAACGETTNRGTSSEASGSASGAENAAIRKP